MKFSTKLIQYLILCFTSTLLFQSAANAQGQNATTPVLVELFTSEGCSSCPPAENIMKDLCREYGNKMILISEHVDYWNHLGWKDPFSKYFYTKRQYKYTRSLDDGAYTPQVVVNGYCFSGGNNRKAIRENIEFAQKTKFTAGKISQSVNPPDQTGKLNSTVKISIPEYLAPKESVNLCGVLIKNEVISNVKGGENRGNKLNHKNVVLEFQTIPNLSMKTPITQKITFNHIPSDNLELYQIVVFLQGDKSGRIYLVNAKPAQ